MIQGLKQLKLETHVDKRGSINEIFKSFIIKSVTHTLSLPETLRGIHVQGWDKVIYVAKGTVYAQFLDDRKDSKSYKETESFLIPPGQAYFVPSGVGNSYCVIGEEPVHYFYFNTENYNRKKMYILSYKKLKWPYKPIVSEQDERGKNA